MNERLLLDDMDIHVDENEKNSPEDFELASNAIDILKRKFGITVDFHATTIENKYPKNDLYSFEEVDYKYVPIFCEELSRAISLYPSKMRPNNFDTKYTGIKLPSHIILAGDNLTNVAGGRAGGYYPNAIGGDYIVVQFAKRTDGKGKQVGDLDYITNTIHHEIAHYMKDKYSLVNPILIQSNDKSRSDIQGGKLFKYNFKNNEEDYANTVGYLFTHGHLLLKLAKSDDALRKKIEMITGCIISKPDYSGFVKTFDTQQYADLYENLGIKEPYYKRISGYEMNFAYRNSIIMQPSLGDLDSPQELDACIDRLASERKLELQQRFILVLQRSLRDLKSIPANIDKKKFVRDIIIGMLIDFYECKTHKTRNRMDGYGEDVIIRDRKTKKFLTDHFYRFTQSIFEPSDTEPTKSNYNQFHNYMNSIGWEIKKVLGKTGIDVFNLSDYFADDEVLLSLSNNPFLWSGILVELSSSVEPRIDLLKE